ncbi:hypothetical protein BC628DRAFT_1318066 [Trametes gibbosa]|nr:hypothetical protein BC628DRAFT_1318066 [Trametes gibbosa]
MPAFRVIPAAVLLLPFALSSAPLVNAAASLTPPVESPSGSVALSLSLTPLPSGANATVSASGSAASTSGSGTTTSSARFPSLSGLSSCASQCFGLAISQDGCNSIVDVNCYCTNTTRFTSALVACISTQCPNDLASAESISQQFCALASRSTSLSFSTSTPSTTFSDPFTSSTSAPSDSASASSTSPPSGTSVSSSASAPPTSSTGTGQNGAAAKRLAGITGLLGLVLGFAGVVFA